jgi:hypothetical protein
MNDLAHIEPHDRDIVRDAIARLRSSSTAADKFAALRDAGAKLHPVTSSEAIDLVSEHAIDIEQMDADLVHRALAAGRARSPTPKSNGKAKAEPFDWKKAATKGKGIRTMIFNPVTFLVPGLIPNEGITLICSKPKVGKSWLVLDIAIAATMDRYVLGDIKPVQGDVLYLALEADFCNTNAPERAREREREPNRAGRQPATQESTNMTEPEPGFSYEEIRDIEEKFKAIVLRTRKEIGAGDDVGHKLAWQFLLAAHADPELQAIVLGERTSAVVYAFLNHLFWSEDVDVTA